jgi:hypothetical protein
LNTTEKKLLQDIKQNKDKEAEQQEEDIESQKTNNGVLECYILLSNTHKERNINEYISACILCVIAPTVFPAFMSFSAWFCSSSISWI